MVQFQAILLFKQILQRHWGDNRNNKLSLFNQDRRRGTASTRNSRHRAELREECTRCEVPEIH